MRRRRLDVGQDEAPSVQITPMINVIIVIVALFAGGSAMVRLEERLGVKLPTGHFDPAMKVEKILLLEIKSDGRYWVQGKAVAAKDLERRLAEGRDGAVMIRPEGATSHASVMAALEACSGAGVVRVSFAPAR